MNSRKVIFIDLAKNFYERHAISILSSVLDSNGITSFYVKEKKFSSYLKKIKEINPDLLVYSCMSNNIHHYIEFDELVKKNIRVKSIIGGPGATFDWKIINESTIDALCIGEGEYAVIEYIRNGFLGNKNIICKGQNYPTEFFPLSDLNKLPFPNRDIVYKRDPVLKHNPSKQFLSGRGCPYACTYCHNHVFNKIFKEYGAIVRKKSIDYIIEEIKGVRERYELKLVVFQDDTFIVDRGWFKEFAERFPKEIGLPYTCNIRANLITEEVVRLLKDSKCIAANWSIESGNDFFRNTVLKRNISKEQILKTGYLLNKYKVPHRIANLIGLPGEKFEDMLSTLELNINVNPNYGYANIFIPFPGLEITDYALRNDYLSFKNKNNLPKSFYRSSMLKIPLKKNIKIQKLTYMFSLLVKHPNLYKNRIIFKALFLVPRVFLNAYFKFSDLYNLSRLYKVKVSLRYKLTIILRYLNDI